MGKTTIPASVYYIFFGLGILLSIGLIIYVVLAGKYSSVTKNVIVWFSILMILNLSNLIFTFVYYSKKKKLVGQKGETGKTGPRGFAGENLRCGDTLCGSLGKNECDDSEKDREGNCIITGGTIDENGKEREKETNIQYGRCKFPFVYNFKNQYKCLDKNNPDYPKEGEERMGLPFGGENEGVCATDLNPDKTVRTWGFCTGNSVRAKEMSYTNQKTVENERLQEKHSGILDLTIATGDTDKEAKCPNGYTKIDGDLNQGEGAYIYLCSKDGISTTGVINVGIAKGNDTCDKVFPNAKKGTYRKLPTNLNKDTEIGTANTEELYMCVEKGRGNLITDIQITDNINYNKDGDLTHYSKINGDLNKDTGGMPVYLYTTTKHREVHPLKSAFYIPEEKQLLFTMGKYGEDVYEYDIDTKKVKTKESIYDTIGQVPKNYEAISYIDGKLYVFKGNLVYELKDKKIQMGFPKKIDSLFPHIPRNIDAAFENPNDGDVYFFKDKLVYRFQLNNALKGAALGKLLEKYPKTIGNVFKGAPHYPDAVFSVPDKGEDKHIFIVTATTFRVFDEDSIIIKEHTIQLDKRFGLNTHGGFKDNSKKSNSATVKEGFAIRDTFAIKEEDYEEDEDDEPIPWEGCPGKEFQSLDGESCEVKEGHRKWKKPNSFANELEKGPLFNK